MLQTIPIEVDEAGDGSPIHAPLLQRWLLRERSRQYAPPTYENNANEVAKAFKVILMVEINQFVEGYTMREFGESPERRQIMETLQVAWIPTD